MGQVAKKRQIVILDKIKEQPSIFLPENQDYINQIPDAMPEGCEEFGWWKKNQNYSENVDDMLRGFKLRKEWTAKGMWAFVSWQWVNPFSEWIGNRKCLEVMSGCGWLSLALRSKGVNVIATDDMSWHNHEMRKETWKHVTEVENLDAIDAIKKYAKEVDIVIMSWPPYDENIGYRVLKEMNRQNKKAQMVYIGEGCGGCTADDEFFEHFQEIEDDEKFNEVSEKFQAWEAIHDRLRLGKYSKKLE